MEKRKPPTTTRSKSQTKSSALWELIRERASRLTNFPSVNIVGIDLSYRATGFCFLTRKTKEYSTLRVESSRVFEHNPIERGFDGYQTMSVYMNLLTEKLLRASEHADIAIIEIPTFTQDDKSAVTTGMCWMVAQQIQIHQKCVFVSPQILKDWSGSKKGDGKEVVKEKVLSRLQLFTKDDNIIDAAGLALMFNDQISKMKQLETQA